MLDDVFSEIFPLGEDKTPYRLLTTDGVSVDKFRGENVTLIEPQALTFITSEAFRDLSHLLRPGHLSQLRAIFDDPEASTNDRFVAFELLKNANIAAGMILPMCQDTGTAIVMGKKGHNVWTRGTDDEAISRGVADAYSNLNLRYSQLSAVNLFEEINTGNNLPAQIDIYATHGNSYRFMFMAKGGGSANKTFLYQKTKAFLNPDGLRKFFDDEIKTLGTAACPPYHLAIVIGGTSAEMTLKTVKLASARYLDTLPTRGGNRGQAFRDVEMEQQVLDITRDIGIGAQFGGKYYCHDVRVIRLPRHSASCPVGIGVSCSADRQILGKITTAGTYLEQLETNPAHYLPDIKEAKLSEEVVKIDLSQSMDDIRAELSRHSVKTRVSLTGPMVVARDIAHARIKERLENGESMPAYFKDCPVYYAGPAKTPEGFVAGAFGPTTGGRMDSYVDLFQSHGGSMVMLAKGNRSKQVTEACKKHKGFYLGSIGGAAARLAENSIKKVEVLEYPELGMEAIWRIEVEDFPAFIIVDDKGNNFFSDI